MASRLPTAPVSARRPAQPPPTYVGRSHVAIFVRSLHLLDLDLLEDWPGITESTFTAKASQQNLQHRLKSIEWSLYRLFELYDATDTKDKLRPFFPPASNLQSLNLRAALYRCLTEMKRNGVLGGHIQLRKTMLDECKGDKFEEAIATFAMIVLRKIMKERNVEEGKVPAGCVVPLILAYRNKLQTNLKQREQLRSNHQAFQERYRSAGAELNARRKEIDAQSHSIHDGQIRELRSFVHANWIGNRLWADLLTQGLPVKPVIQEHPVLPDQPFTRDGGADAKQNFLDGLDARLKQHQERLAEWTFIAKDLKAKHKSIRTAIPEPALQKPESKIFELSKHQQLHLNHKVPKSHSQPGLTPAYQNLLQEMSRDLAASVRTDRDDHTRKANVERFEVSQQVLTSQQDQTMTSLLSPGEDTSGIFNTAYRDASVDREPVTRRLSSSHDEENKLILPPTPHDALPPLEKLKVADSPRTVTSSPVSSLPDDLTSSTWIPTSVSSAMVATSTPISKLPERSVTPEVEDDVEDPEPPTSPSKEWMSLVERTRVSMSGLSNYKQPLDGQKGDHDLQGIPEVPPEPETPLPASHSIGSEENRRATLLERTRQSMSLFSTSNAAGARSRKSMRQSHRMSQLFPINQFETPGRPRGPRPSEFGPSSESSTPREKLFEDSADYASVFKSRPKLAQSPVMSPENSMVGFDSILEQDMEGLDLVSDDEDDDYYDEGEGGYDDGRGGRYR